MSEISRVALFGKLNPLAYKAIEGATVFCKLRGNPYVELVHWLAQLVQNARHRPRTRILRHYQLDPRRWRKDMTAALDRLPRGATAHLRLLRAHRGRDRARLGLRHAACSAQAQVRTGYLLVGMLKTQQPAQRAARASRASSSKHQGRRPGRRTSSKICGGIAEAKLGAQDGSAACGGGAARRGQRRDGAGRDGQAGGAEEVHRRPDRAGARRARWIRSIGRDEEIRQIVDILMRRRQNNPILTGEAGVGKTAVVEGFAQRIARGDVPPQLKDVSLLLARPRPAAGRRQHEGRVRAAAAPGHRRGAGQPEADHPVHRRGAHAGRRGRRRRHRRRGQPAEAGAGARQPAHDRRHHLGRVQEVHREGSGADAPLPGRAGGRARRAEGDPDAARRRHACSRSTTACSCSTRRSRRR